MAASSPAKSNSSAAADAATPSSSSAAKSQRGLNKPKCIKCGNVARSRCPYQSCKNCCAKAQNPCHIHVLKGSSSLPDKPPTSGSPLFDQQSTDGSHSGTNRLRHLSSNFSQFSNLQSSFRSRKPLTKKDAQVINEWRFLKLKEFKERKVEAEGEAFDRYMQNVDLLEEIFLFNSASDNQIPDETSSEDNTKRLIQELKLKLRSSPARSDNFRKRIQYIVDQGLKKLKKVELAEGTSDPTDEGVGHLAKKIKLPQGERTMSLSDLIEKMNRAQNEEDLKACRDTAAQIFKWNSTTNSVETEEVQSSKEQNPTIEASITQPSSLFPPKWVNPIAIDQSALCRLDAQFSSLDHIEDDL
ncbi:uncharacterized protein LOC127261230 [Andrographis paniculata]|uniref:uncharacterized protein LOC127261230 n=1 Tax=Andrographis paniculata TaxID=175694 RepID=UPI0021E89F12|nr:uncharacterized protein LOC127261230 [Andrographis paniculata]